MALLEDLKQQLAHMEAAELDQQPTVSPVPFKRPSRFLSAVAPGAALGSALAQKQGLKVTDYPQTYGIGAGELTSLVGKGLGTAGEAIQKAAVAEEPETTALDPLSSGFQNIYKAIAKRTAPSAIIKKAPLAKKPRGASSEIFSAIGKKLEGAEKPFTKLGEQTKAYYEPLLSNKARELKNTAWYKAEGLGAKFVSASLQATESAPQTAAIAVAGAPMMTGLKASGAVSGMAAGLKRLGLNTKWAGNIATWLSEGLAYAAPEGLLAGLSNADEISKQITAMTHEQLLESPKYQEYFAETADMDKAKQQLIEDTEIFSLGSTLAASMVTGMVTGGGLFGSAGASKNFLLRRVMGFAKEGVQEFFQSGPGEKAPQNLAIQLFIDPEQDVMQDVWAAAAAGAGPGALMGGFVGSGTPGPKSPIEVLEEAEKQFSIKRQKALIKLKAEKVPDEELIQMARSPGVLQEYGLKSADVEALLENRSRAAIDLNNYQEMLDSAPTDAVKRGMLTSAQGLAAQKLRQTMSATLPKIKEPEIEEPVDDREKTKQEKRQAPPPKKEAPKTVGPREPITETKRYQDLQRAKSSVLELYSTQPTPYDIESTKIEHAKKLTEATKKVEDLRQELDVDIEAGKVDRRIDTARRKTVEEMSTEEMRKELLVNPLTGIPNRRAIVEVMQTAKEEGKPKSVVFLDADSLKTINDLGGHAAGDALLQALADSIKEVEPKLGGHISGDEFIILADNAEEAKVKTDKLDKILANKEIVFALENGDEYTYSGLGASYGIAETIEEADRKMGLHKIEREKAGTRVSRGAVSYTHLRAHET